MVIFRMMRCVAPWVRCVYPANRSPFKAFGSISIYPFSHKTMGSVENGYPERKIYWRYTQFPLNHDYGSTYFSRKKYSLDIHFHGPKWLSIFPQPIHHKDPSLKVVAGALGRYGIIGLRVSAVVIQHRSQSNCLEPWSWLEESQPNNMVTWFQLFFFQHLPNELTCIGRAWKLGFCGSWKKEI